MIGARSLNIGKTVMSGDAFECRRRYRTEEPLQHAVIGLADAADIAVAPGLTCNPFDHVDHVLHIVVVEKAKLAAEATRTTHVHVHINVALAEVKIDRAGFAPQKLRACGQAVVIEPIG